MTTKPFEYTKEKFEMKTMLHTDKIYMNTNSNFHDLIYNFAVNFL